MILKYVIILLTFYLLINIITCNNKENDYEIYCKYCGKIITHTSKSSVPPLTSTSIGSTTDEKLGKDSKLDYFNYENKETEKIILATFKDAKVKEEISIKSIKQDFYPNYNWKYIYCLRCNKHLGWHFYHLDAEKCFLLPPDDVTKNDKKKLSIGTKDLNKDNFIDSTYLKEASDFVELNYGERCLTAKKSWWTYEICYKSEVRQYYLNEEDTRHPDWSIGTFDSEETMERMKTHNKNKYKNKVEIVHVFKNGQKCDENGKNRQSIVIFKCCPSSRDDDETNVPTIEDISEPMLCSYKIIICIPELCTFIKENKIKNIEINNNNNKLKNIPKENCIREFNINNKNKNIKAEFYGLLWNQILLQNSKEYQIILKNLNLETSIR